MSHLIDGFNDGGVEVVPLPEEGVEGDLADLGPHGGLGQLGDGKLRILHPVTGLIRIADS